MAREGVEAVILVSPTERAAVQLALRDATKGYHRTTGDVIDMDATSMMPENKGVDFLWRSQGRWWGVQRKQLNDLLASFDDGRLSKEIAQMRAAIAMPHLVIEGRIASDNSGMLMKDGWGRPVSLSSLRSRVLTIGYEGVHVSYTRDIRATASLVVDAYVWSRRANHSTAKTRPKPTNDWGKLSNKEYQAHLLQGLPGVGPGLAEAIIDTLGFPLALTATVEDLLRVPGLGEKKARKLVASMSPNGGA